MVEGKDHPKELGKSAYNKNGGDTCGLLLRMEREIWVSGRELVLNSVFCILQKIIVLRKVGCFTVAVIKKRRYWPNNVDGEVMKGQFGRKEVGYTDNISLLIDG